MFPASTRVPFSEAQPAGTEARPRGVRYLGSLLFGEGSSGQKEGVWCDGCCTPSLQPTLSAGHDYLGLPAMTVKVEILFHFA